MDDRDNAEFDVLLSFSGSEREYARAIHKIASANGVSVFLDEEFQHEIWGKNLIEFLSLTYRKRGRYVLILLSHAYRSGAYTRVERRSAFERMIREADEYILPVKVDDSWVDGLPESTAYLDLRTHGVLGVCEVLVRKIRGSTEKLQVPDGLAVPRVPLGRLPGEQLEKYLMELCSRPQVTVFGALVYDEKNAGLRKLLRDQDYWDALHTASGPHFEVFAIRDTEAPQLDEGELRIDMMTATDLPRIRSRVRYFSVLLDTYFGEEKTRLVYPSFLLFIADRLQIRHCRLIPFRRAPVEETFESLLRLFELIAAAIAHVGGPTASHEELWTHLCEKLLEAKYTVYIQRPPDSTPSAVHELVSFVEQ